MDSKLDRVKKMLEIGFASWLVMGLMLTAALFYPAFIEFVNGNLNILKNLTIKTWEEIAAAIQKLAL